MSKPKKPKKPTTIETISPEQWSRELVEHLAIETSQLISAEEQNYGTEWADQVRFSLITSLIASFTYSVLSEEPSGARDLAHATAVKHQCYKEFKEMMESCIASGFEGAFLTYAGAENAKEFVVKIEPVPEPVNKMMC